MSLFASSTYDKAKEIGDGGIFTPFAESLYEAVITDVQVIQQQATDWSGGNPVKTDELEDSVEVTFLLEKPVDGDKLLDINGDEANFYNIKFWFSPIKTGTSSRGPSRARLFLCAAMGWDEKEKINLEILEKLLVDKTLIDKKLKLYISVTDRKDGSKGNKIERFLGIKEKKA